MPLGFVGVRHLVLVDLLEHFESSSFTGASLGRLL